ncbi:hypothetical protein NQZ68_037837 [Dissostichus eleginoides]|nr:hypothetical protein NQZ68_037837 [Dissostichus eleginoides]
MAVLSAQNIKRHGSPDTGSLIEVRHLSHMELRARQAAVKLPQASSKSTDPVVTESALAALQCHFLREVNHYKKTQLEPNVETCYSSPTLSRSVVRERPPSEPVQLYKPPSPNNTSLQATTAEEQSSSAVHTITLLLNDHEGGLQAACRMDGYENLSC